MTAADDPVHVYPVDEPHALTEQCWCRPRVELIDPVTGRAYAAPLVVHRDASERAAAAS